MRNALQEWEKSLETTLSVGPLAEAAFGIDRYLANDDDNEDSVIRLGAHVVDYGPPLFLSRTHVGRIIEIAGFSCKRLLQIISAYIACLWHSMLVRRSVSEHT